MFVHPRDGTDDQDDGGRRNPEDEQCLAKHPELVEDDVHSRPEAEIGELLDDDPFSRFGTVLRQR